MSAAQRAPSRLVTVATPRTAREYRDVARWWNREADRPGATASADARVYAANMRHAARLVAVYGPGTWAQLHERLAIDLGTLRIKCERGQFPGPSEIAGAWRDAARRILSGRERDHSAASVTAARDRLRAVLAGTATTLPSPAEAAPAAAGRGR